MHSRVIQLSLEPISNENYIEADYENGFLSTIADYTSEDTDRNEDIKWIDDYIKDYGAELNNDNKSFYFPRGFKNKYFEKRFECLKEMIDKMSLNTFSCSDSVVYNIDNLSCNKYGFYISIDNDNEYIPLDSFVRNLNEDTTYYIGGTLDYHF